MSQLMHLCKKKKKKQEKLSNNLFLLINIDALDDS